MIKLRGLTWDHPRGYDSVVAATTAFEKVRPDIQVIWRKRSLKEFGDQPLQEIVEEFDLLMIDHPFVGEAHQNQLLTRLELILPKNYLSEQSDLHIGKTYLSYNYHNHQYAIPIDAAAQFSAFNDISISRHEIPKTWDQFTEMMSQTSFSEKVIWPLCPTDFWCSFLTISAQYAGKDKKVFNSSGIDPDFALKTLILLKTATENLPKESWKLNPIQGLELMKKGRYSFAPLLFGYISYSQKASPLQFSNALAIDSQIPVSLLGGVGLAISAYARNKKECAEFMQFFLRDEILSGCYFENNGQPSLLSSWNSGVLNKESKNFFAHTMASMNNAFVRPRIPGFNKFQESAARYLHENFRRTREIRLIEHLNHLYTIHCL
ncbi:MAG: extracellular solute-binding protein [Cyclobacteriaceae bacterium]|jgi:multiple sugar transport system substrate-binding protein